LAEYFKLIGNSDSAFYHLHKTKQFSDSLYTLEKASAINEIQARYETEKREKELLANREKMALQQLDIEEKNRTVSLIMFLFILMSSAALFIYLYQKQKQEKRIKDAEMKAELEKAASENKIQTDRLRISKELHDNIGAQLTFIKAKIGSLQNKFPQASLELNSIDDFTQSTIDELRKTVWLVNHKNLGIEEFCIKIQDLYRKVPKIQVHFEIDDQAMNKEFDSLKGIHLFRFLQEAVNNALKYSESEKIDVLIEADKENMYISVKDYGKGFDVTKHTGGYGLRNMKSRIEELDGQFSIQSEVSKGTQIKAQIRV